VKRIVFEAGPVALEIRVGAANGPRLILLHGVTRRGSDFAPILAPLAFAHEVHAIDLRGHGGSGRVKGSYRVVDYIPDILAYVRDLGPEPVILLGHSLGAMVAAGVAARIPGLVRALVLEDPTFEMTAGRREETSFPDLFRAFREHAGSDRPTAEIARALAEATIRVPGQPSPVPLGRIRDAASLRFSASCLKRLDPDVLDPGYEGLSLDGYDVPGTLQAISCPTLLLQGDHAAGGALPDDYAAELARSVRDVSHVSLPGIGHNIHSAQPAAMARLVLDFLGSID
jgi:pimeloyl-ACP methyl ester carboxylesterase